MSSWFRAVTLLPLFVLGCASDRQSALPAAPGDLVAAMRGKAAHVCSEASASALAARGVTAGALASAYYIPVSTGGRDASRLSGWEAWITLAGQPGSIVVEHNVNCSLRQVYARDGASLPR